MNPGILMCPSAASFPFAKWIPWIDVSRYCKSALAGEKELISSCEGLVKAFGSGAEESWNRQVGQAFAVARNKGSSEVCTHWACSKSFSGKKGMKLSHGNFWPSHEKTFSKRAVNLMVEWVTAHGQGWKSHQLNYSKLNWTIKKCMVKANIPAGLSQRDAVSLFELFLCIFRPNLHGKITWYLQSWECWGQIISIQKIFLISLVFRVKFIEWRPDFQYCYCGRPGAD